MTLTTTTCWHEIGHIVGQMALDEKMEAAWIRPAPDGSGEVEAITSTASQSGGSDVVYAIAFGFASSSPDLAKKLIMQPAKMVAGVFQMMLEGPQELTDTVGASPQDLAILKASYVPDEFWQVALGDALAATMTDGVGGWIDELINTYTERGIVTLTRHEITALMNGEVPG